MAWITGNQIKTLRNDLVKEGRTHPSVISEEDAKVFCGRFLFENIGLCWEIISGGKIFPFQEIVLRSWFKRDHNLCIAGRGVGKCIDKNAVVLSDKGFKQIKDIRPGDKVYTQKRFCDVLEKIDNPEEDGYEVSTTEGFSVRGKIGHKVLVFNDTNLEFEYKNIEDIEAGQFIPIKYGMDCFGNEDIQTVIPKFKTCTSTKDCNIVVDEDLYYLFGLILGDGCTRFTGNVFSISSMDDETREFLAAFKGRVFSENKLQVVQKDGNFAADYKICNKKFHSFLGNVGFDLEAYSWQKDIPISVLNSKKEYLRACIQGLFDCDAGVCIQENPKKNATRCTIEYSSSSLEMIRNVRRVLLNFGIISSLAQHRKAGRETVNGQECQIQDSWRLSISNKKFIERFHQEIGFRLSRKRGLVDYYLNSFRKRKDYNSNRFPVGKYLKSKYLSRYTINETEWKIHPGVGEERIKEIVKTDIFTASDKEKLENLLEDWHIVKVKKKTPIQLETVDIQVEDDECYWSDGMIHHNSYLLAIFALLFAIFYPNTKIVIVANVFRRCLNKRKTLCFTNSGPKCLAEISRDDKVASYKTDRKVLSAWDNPVQDSLIVRTKRGFSFEGVLEHKTLVYNPERCSFGYKELRDLQKGEYLPLKIKEGAWGDYDICCNYLPQNHDYRQKRIVLPERDSSDLFYLFGLILGDGCIQYDPSQRIYRVFFCGNDQETLDFVFEQFSKLCPDNKIQISHTETRCKRISVNNKNLIDFFIHCGFTAETATFKSIPNKIFSCPKKHIARMLSGLYDTDGSIHVKKKDGCAEIKLATSAPDLARELQILLLNFGILSSVGQEKAKGEIDICGVKTFGKESYGIKIYDKENLFGFRDQIDFGLSRKRSILHEYLLDKSFNLSEAYIIPGIGRYLSERYKFGGRFRYRENISSCQVSKILAEEKISHRDRVKINRILNSNFYFVPVEEIIPSRCETRDLDVETENCYIANGFIHHNCKDIFNYIEKFLASKRAFLLRGCFVKRGVVKHADQYILKCQNGSQIKGLPLSGEGLRGERANLLIIDEGLLISKHIQETILTPFLTAKQEIEKVEKIKIQEDELIAKGLMTEDERYAPPKNKMLITSSASYKFEHLYKGLFIPYIENILKEGKRGKDDPLYSVTRISYEALPDRSIMDESIIKAAKDGKAETPGFKREYRAMFVDGSDGFFDIQKLHECTVEDGQLPTVEVFGEKGAEYMLTIDPSYNASEAGDYFAFGIYKMVPDLERILQVHTYGEAIADINEHYKYLIYLLKAFNIVFIVIDASGSEFIESFNNSAVAIENKINLKFIEVDFEAEGQDYTKALEECRNQLNKESGRIVYRQPFQSKINLRMNQHLQSAIYESKIWFASRICQYTSAYNKAKSYKLPFQFKQFLYKEEDDENPMFSMHRFLIDQDDWLQETKDQLGLIEVTPTALGSLQFNIPSHMRKSKDADRPRRDNYTCLLMAAYGIKHYYASMKQPVEPEMDTTIIPQMF